MHSNLFYLLKPHISPFQHTQPELTCKAQQHNIEITATIKYHGNCRPWIMNASSKKILGNRTYIWSMRSFQRERESGEQKIMFPFLKYFMWVSLHGDDLMFFSKPGSSFQQPSLWRSHLASPLPIFSLFLVDMFTRVVSPFKVRVIFTFHANFTRLH